MAASLEVVCIPDMEWDSLLWTNRQHVMARLPRAVPGARVLYASPPRFALAGTLGGRQRLRPDRVSGAFPSRREPGLWVSQPRLPVPSRVVHRTVPTAIDRLALRSIRRGMRRLGFEQPVLWSYTPLALPLAGRLGERLLCYDVVDDYPELPNYRSPRVAAWHRELLRRADLVFTSSEALQARCRRVNPRCHLVGNAADVRLFLAAREGRLEQPDELRALPRPLIGFHGAVTGYKLDLDLLRELALRRPGWSFVLVGPVQDRDARSALRGLPNVHLLGPRDQRELPAYVGAFDVCFVPYRRTAYTESVSPLKLVECLAAGRPVVATDLPGLRPHLRWVVRAGGLDGLERAISAQLRAPHQPPPTDALRRWSWEAKAERLGALVCDALGEARR